MTPSFFFILQCTEYGECVRALLIEKYRSEIWMGWGMMEPDSFLSQTVTSISTPYCLRWHKSRPMVRGSSWGVGWHEIDVLCLSINAPHLTGQMGLFLKIQHWYCSIISEDTTLILLYYFWRYNIDIALSSDMELRPLVFYDVFVFQISLLLVYTSGALNDTKFCLRMICFLFCVKSYWNDLLI
jgi:hypothetical protein